MILAAGLGTRLRPLTHSTPKALVLFCGRPLIEYSLLLLKKHGIREVIVNLHYLGELIEQHLGNGQRFGMCISYSWEPVLLGTGGGIRKAERFFGKDPFIVLNSDVILDIDLQKLVRHHHKHKPLATMAVRAREDTSYTEIILDKRNFITSISKGESASKANWMFTGAQVIDPALLHFLPHSKEETSCIIRNAYQPALEAGKRIAAFPYQGYWNDLGTLERYRQAENELASGKAKLSFLY